MNVEMVKEMKEEKLSYEVPEIKDLTMVDSILGTSGFVDDSDQWEDDNDDDGDEPTF